MALVQTAVENILLLKGAVVGVWLLIWFGMERLRPNAHEWVQAADGDDEAVELAARQKGRVARWFRNGALFGINSLLSPLLVIPISATMAAHGPDWRAEWLPFLENGTAGLVVELAVDVLLLDLFIYAWHRANHEIPFLWRFHQVHHFDRHLDVTTAVRFHFGEVLLSALTRGVVVALLDIPISSVVIFEAVVVICSIFHHSNARLPRGVEKALAAVIITPGIHWVHHHATRRDTDSNYGTLFSFWDRLFRSRSGTARWRDMPIGLEGEARDLSLIKLLLAPARQPR